MDEQQKTKVSLINLNVVASDAIGTCIINQVRVFQRRGDDVRLYVQHPLHDVPADVEAVTSVVTLKDLIGGRHGHFDTSDLYIYHYPSRHDLMESIRGIEHGTVIFYYHNVTPPELWGSEEGRELLIKGIEGKALAHYADLCIADSPLNKQELVDEIGYDADRVFVLPLTVKLDQFAPGAKDPELIRHHQLEGQQVLLFVGRIAGNKRIDLLIEALAQIKDRMPDTKLLLVGDESGTTAYRQIAADARKLATELGIAEDVIWVGHKHVSELPAYYRLADVYVSASLHEGFGVPLIEAMASGVPVVASRAGAMPWVVGNAGLLSEPGSADDLAAKALTVLQNADLRQTFVKRGLERVKTFSLEQYEADLEQLLEQAVTYTLPKLSDQPSESDIEAVSAKASATAAREGKLLNLLADELEKENDVAMRDYVVRSKAPLVGPFIAWVRRNMTSHLREPYLDPIVERQVNVNQRITEWMKRASTTLAASAQYQSTLEAQIEDLQTQIQDLKQRLGEEEVNEED